MKTLRYRKLDITETVDSLTGQESGSAEWPAVKRRQWGEKNEGEAIKDALLKVRLGGDEKSRQYLVETAMRIKKRGGTRWKDHPVFAPIGHGLVDIFYNQHGRDRELEWIFALLGDIGNACGNVTREKIIGFCTKKLHGCQEMLDKAAEIAEKSGEPRLLVRACMRRRDENERSSESEWEFVKNERASKALVSMGLKAVPAIVEGMGACGTFGFSEVLDGAILKDSSAKSVPQMCRMLRRHMQEGRNVKKADRTAFCALADRLIEIHGETGERLEPADAKNIQKCVVELCKRTGFYKKAAEEFGKLLEENKPPKRGRKFRRNWQKRDAMTGEPRERPLGWALPQRIKRDLLGNNPRARERAQNKIARIVERRRG